jgi:CRP-like cAMP-binding protein
MVGGLSLTEIKDLIRVACEDRDPNVRSAAQAAEQAMEGPPTIERARKEGFVLSTIEKIISMKKVPFFQGMTIEQLNALTNVCEEMLCESGTRIFEQGDPGGALYVVVSGLVSIERAGQRRNSVVRLATIGANAYFGEMTLFNRDSRSAAAVTIQDTLLLRLRREPLLALLRRYPDLSVELINVLSQRLRDASDRIAQLTRSRPRELQKLYDKLG